MLLRHELPGETCTRSTWRPRNPISWPGLSRFSEEIEYDPETGRAYNQSDLEQFGPAFDVHTGEPIGSLIYSGYSSYPALEWVDHQLYGVRWSTPPFPDHPSLEFHILDPVTGYSRRVGYLERSIGGLAYQQTSGRLLGIAYYDFTSVLVSMDLGTGESHGDRHTGD
jgi:hypothetical protein